ncbi:MAG: hypothetical protein QM739_15435 [Propionivibrio sp.]
MIQGTVDKKINHGEHGGHGEETRKETARVRLRIHLATTDGEKPESRIVRRARRVRRG